MEQKQRLRIAYFSINDPRDKRSWSGITYYLGQTLQRNVGDVDFLGPVKIPWGLDKTFRALQKLSRLLVRREWIPKYSLIKNIYAAFWLKKKMKGKKYDLLIAPAAASELAYLKTDLPIVYFGDSTFKAYSESYDKEFKNVSDFSRWEGDHLERRSLSKSQLIVLSSHWAANSAIHDYNITPGKIVIMPLCANIDSVPPKEIFFNKQQNQVLTLIFLAVDWDRKGGAIAFDALEHLNKAGIEAKLIVCGCIPPPQYQSAQMEVIPFLDKNKTTDYTRFVQLLSSVHFLILPTRADCSLLVACEANAYGVPAITTNVGGVPDIVKDGINGYCLPFDADGKQYASLIANVFSDKAQYNKLVELSRGRFEEELNWNKWAEHFKDVLKDHHLSVAKKDR